MLARVGLGLSALFLALSALYVAAMHDPANVERIPFPAWIHVGVLALLFTGFWELNRLRRTDIGVRVNPLDLPAGYVILFFVVLAVALPIHMIWKPPQRFALGTEAPDGSAVNHQHWEERDGRHFLVLNRRMAVEVTKAEYLDAQAGMGGNFARIWMVFSFIALVFWRYLGRRREQSRRALDEGAALIRQRS